MKDRTDISPDFACGLDEAGRGPVIGPMVVALVCASNKEMRDIGSKDSKLLSPSARNSLFTKITGMSLYHFEKLITSSEINQRMEHETLNKIEEETYASLIDMVPDDLTFFVDSFDVKPERLSQLLSEKTGRNVICSHKADTIYPVVSAASIIAKVLRDREIENLKSRYGDFGSGYPSDPKTVQFIRSSVSKGIDLSHIVRTHWSTYRRILAESGRTRLY